MSDPVVDLVGGCQCGAVRFRVTGRMNTHGAMLCHCRMCQRAHGAPAVAWASFPPEAVCITQGTPARYRSSPPAERHFCAICGTPLFFVWTEPPRYTDVALACLDDPAAIAPTVQIWTDSKAPWLDVAAPAADRPRSLTDG